MTPVEHAQALLRKAPKTLVITGDVLSEESGLGAFLQMEEEWRGQRIRHLRTVIAFFADPAFVWEFHRAWRKAANAAAPNDAHCALAAWVERTAARCFTFCVDDLHERAAISGHALLRGSLFSRRCGKCGEVRSDRSVSPGDIEQKHCARCNVPERPGILCTDEEIAFKAWAPVLLALYEAEALLIVGTAREDVLLLASMARDLRRPVIQVNPVGRGIQQADISLYGSLSTFLPQLLSHA